MKRILLYLFLVLGLLLCNNSFAANTKGKGEVKLSNQSVNHFLDYLSGKIVKGVRWNPMFFVLSSDGAWSTYYYCPYSSCQDSGVRDAITVCEDETGVKCAVFARRRTVVWDNETNMPRKEKKFSSKWSFEEVKAQLEKLGFYGDGTTQTEKITTDQPNDDVNIADELSKLINLYESGHITKEEFNKAKKKILN